MPVYSHSRLSTFEQCKLKFKFAYIDKIKPDFPTSIEAFMGSRVHDALEKLYKDLRYNKLNELKDLLIYYNNEWENKFNDNIKIVKKDYTPQNYKEAGQRFIATYFETHKPFNQDITIGTEMHVMIDLPGNKKIQGYIDRLATNNQGTYFIHDYKTGNSLPPQSFADEDRQLALYSIAVREKYQDCKDIKLLWHYLSFNKILHSQRSLEQLELLKQKISALIDDIESATSFLPTQSALCNWCQFRSKCPLFKHQYTIETSVQKSLTANEGVELVDKYSVLKQKKDEIDQQMEELKAKILQFAAQEGLRTIVGNKTKARLTEYAKLSFPKKDDPRQKQFYETVKKIGLWEKLASPDLYELAKMINNNEIHPELTTLLEPFIEKHKTSILRISKK